MMIYKRATKQLRAAGIEDIVIVKRLYGASPNNQKLVRQRSTCFKTWQEAVKAVLDGYRPQEITEEEYSRF